MSGHEPGTDGDDPLIDEAAAWLAKLRLSSGPREREAFETWYAADRAHADAYDKVLRGWNASGSSGDPASDLVPHSQQRATHGPPVQIGRASCRESVCQYVWISVVTVPLNK